MSRLGKCHNYSGCLLAYRGEQTNVPEGTAFVCAECGKPLQEVKASPAKWIGIAVGLGALAALAITATVILPKLKPGKDQPKHAESSPAPARDPARSAGGTEPAPIPNPASKGEAEPPAAVTAVQKINLAVDPTIKAEVLKRIDLMPNVSQVNKDKLYNSVERARQMGLVLTVPFAKGKAVLGAAEIQAIQAELNKPDLEKLRNDPTAVFVILGYADPKGDAKMNLAYSQTRADAVVNAMKREIGIQNVVHAVALGGSTLLDASNLEKNRIAEVWVVLP
ncbi:MAG TPA: hypothetical protein VF593_05805 [Chthoniobacteraceae bacterium]|jgi:outer membrane protein OmpA-like peptidoglycan-associated protein